MPTLLESVRTVKDPIVDRPGDDDADLYEPSPDDRAWWLLQAAAVDAARPRALAAPRRPAAMSAEWLAAWQLASFTPADLPLDAWLDAVAGQHDALVASEVGARHAWLARRLRELAGTARFLGATDPETYDDRAEVLGRS